MYKFGSNDEFFAQAGSALRTSDLESDSLRLFEEACVSFFNLDQESLAVVRNQLEDYLTNSEVKPTTTVARLFGRVSTKQKASKFLQQALDQIFLLTTQAQEILHRGETSWVCTVEPLYAEAHATLASAVGHLKLCSELNIRSKENQGMMQADVDSSRQRFHQLTVWHRHLSVSLSEELAVLNKASVEFHAVSDLAVITDSLLEIGRLGLEISECFLEKSY